MLKYVWCLILFPFLAFAETTNQAVKNAPPLTAVTGNIIPSVDATQDLGSSSKGWANIYSIVNGYLKFGANASFYNDASDSIQILDHNGATTDSMITAGHVVASTLQGSLNVNQLSGIVSATNGGTANAFFQVSGPATSAKTFIFPNSSATVLTSANKVTGSQGGTNSQFFQVSGPASTLKTFTFPNASSIIATTDQTQTWSNQNTYNGLSIFASQTQFTTASPQVQNTVQDLGAGTMSAQYQSLMVDTLHVYQFTNGNVTALGAVTSGDVTVCLLPLNVVVKNVYVQISSAAAGVTTLTVSIGRVGATYNDYILASDAKATAGTFYGAVSGDRGTGMTGYDLSTLANVPVKAHFISTGGNLSSVTSLSGKVYIETYMLP